MSDSTWWVGRRAHPNGEEVAETTEYIMLNLAVSGKQAAGYSRPVQTHSVHLDAHK